MQASTTRGGRSGSGGRNWGRGKGRGNSGKGNGAPQGGGIGDSGIALSLGRGAGHKHPRFEENSESWSVEARQNCLDPNDPRYDNVVATACDYGRILNASTIKHMAYTHGWYKIARNAQGEIVNLAIKPGAPLLPLCVAAEYSISIPLRRVSIDMGADIVPRDEKYERHYEAFVRTQTLFQPTWYDWDQVTVLRNKEGRFLNIKPKDPTKSPSNFIMKPSDDVAGITGKFDNGHACGLRTQRAMFEELVSRTAVGYAHGARHAFAVMETTHFDPRAEDECIMSLFPDFGVPTPDQNDGQSSAATTQQKGKNRAPTSEEIAAQKRADAEGKKEEIEFYSISELDIRRDTNNHITDLIPKDQSKSKVNFLAPHPDKLGYIAKFDQSDKGKKTRKGAEERLVRETGCSLVLGPVIAVPGQEVTDLTAFQFVQTISLARQSARGTQEEAGHRGA